MAATVTVDGGGRGPMMFVAKDDIEAQLVTLNMGTYATGGVAVTLPDEIRGKTLVAVDLLEHHDGTRHYYWDSSASKIVALDAFATEEGNGTDLSAINLQAILYLKS